MSQQNNNFEFNDLFDNKPLSDQDQKLILLYAREGLSVDLLAYTSEFETIYEEFCKLFNLKDYPKSKVFRRLLTLRKSGSLPRISDSHNH